MESRTSNSEKNPGRRYLKCPNNCEISKGGFVWLSGADPEGKQLSNTTAKMMEDSPKASFAGYQVEASHVLTDDPVNKLVNAIDGLVREMARSNNLNQRNMVSLTNNFLSLSKRVEILEMDAQERDDMETQIKGGQSMATA
jgi:hypothetical protein